MFVFQISPVCNFGKFINFGLATVRSTRKLKLGYSSLTFDSMDRTLKCDHSLESCRAVLYCGAFFFFFFFFHFSQFVILGHLSFFELAMSGEKGFIKYLLL